jgi:hypothetical protein
MASTRKTNNLRPRESGEPSSPESADNWVEVVEDSEDSGKIEDVENIKDQNVCFEVDEKDPSRIFVTFSSGRAGRRLPLSRKTLAMMDVFQTYPLKIAAKNGVKNVLVMFKEALNILLGEETPDDSPMKCAAWSTNIPKEDSIMKLFERTLMSWENLV